ncbi:MAG TPA: efflux RND transporter permease subunit [Pseudobacteroides sp.]|uniref:efflux RND transporter permease subunit n=1 Tax=Pseudobacteroides sp. TaxID=1968840 RepID=UPI002F949A4B
MSIFTKFSLKNASAISILCILIVFGGIFSAFSLKKETMPDISMPFIGVQTVYRGAAPGEVEEQITKPLESLIQSVNGVKTVSSTSSEHYSVIIAEFPYSSDMDAISSKVEEAINGAKLPDKADKPKLMRIDFAAMPVLNLSLSNANMSPEELGEKVREVIIPKLSGLPGVGQVSLTGDSQKAVYIKLIPSKLKEYGISDYSAVAKALTENNVTFPAGTISIEGTVEPIKVISKLNTIEDLKNVMIPVLPNTQDLMKSSFSEMGKGVADMGKGMAALGQAVEQLGQGMAGMNQAYDAQIKLINAISTTQSQIVDMKMQLSSAKQTANNEKADAKVREEASKLQNQLQYLIAKAEAGLKVMNEQLKDIQDKMSKQSKMSPKAEAKPDLSKKDSNVTETANSSKDLIPAAAIKQVKLEDIAEVTLSSEKSTSYSRTNGNPSVVIKIMKTQDANTVDVSDAVRKKLEDIKKELPGTDTMIILDQSDYVNESISGMLKEGVMGALFAFIVILLFLKNFRTTIIACVSIPLSVLMTLIVLKVFNMSFYNVTLNILTLGGLSVAIGRIVDDSIVVIENIYRRLQTEDIRNIELIKIATKEVSSAITSSTLTTVSVFLPITFVDGMAGVMFKPFAITLASAMLSSLLVSVTVIPVMSKYLLLKSKKIKHSEFHEGPLMKKYEGLLNWSLNHKAATLLISLALFVGSLALIPLIGTSFIQEQKEQYVGINMSYPPGTDLKIVNDKALELEKVISNEKGIDRYQTTIGSSGASMESMMSGGSNNILAHVEEDVNVDDVIKSLRSKIPSEDGKAKITINSQNPSSGGAGATNNIEVVITGDDIAKIKNAARLVTKEISGIKGLEGVVNNLSESKPEIAVKVDQKKASKFGMSATTVGMAVAGLLNDTKITTMVVDNKTLDVNFGLKADSLKDIDGIKGVELFQGVKLSDVADVSQVPGPVSIFTENGKENAKVTGKITVKDTGAVSKEVQEKINEIALPEGIEVRMGGITEMMDDTFMQMGVAMVLAVFLVFFVMVIALGSISAPISILFSLPLAAIGGMVALFVTRLPLDMPSMIGALMLIGIVVTNAIVLIDRVAQKRREGMEVREALLEAGRVRIRPILMTAIATIAALIPLALGFSKASTMSQSLAVIVIGGLTTSTFLTLVIVPVVYELLEKIKGIFSSKKEAIKGFEG